VDLLQVFVQPTIGTFGTFIFPQERMFALCITSFLETIPRKRLQEPVSSTKINALHQALMCSKLPPRMSRELLSLARLVFPCTRGTSLQALLVRVFVANRTLDWKNQRVTDDWVLVRLSRRAKPNSDELVRVAAEVGTVDSVRVYTAGRKIGHELVGQGLISHGFIGHELVGHDLIGHGLIDHGLSGAGRGIAGLDERSPILKVSAQEVSERVLIVLGRSHTRSSSSTFNAKTQTHSRSASIDDIVSMMT
jgi:hypothetical protein